MTMAVFPRTELFATFTIPRPERILGKPRRQAERQENTRLGVGNVLEIDDVPTRIPSPSSIQC
jgi:hypothetical protein